jgi:hypothetical protein
LRFGRRAEVLRYRAMLDWAIRTIEDDLRDIRAVDPAFPIPPSLFRYRGHRAVDGIPGGLSRPVADEITAMIREVDRIHDLRPDNPLGAPAALPPEASLLSMDPAHLARDVANELNAHVRLDIEGPGGTTVRRWVDPAGRIYAFDPATFDDVALTADQATRAGLWSDQIRREALAHGLGPLDLGRFYRTSWADQRTFEQAVAAEIAERRARLETAHPELPGMFDRALAAAGEWHAEVRRLELEQAELARDITRAEDALDRRNTQLGELDGERFSRTLREAPDRDALRRIAERTRVLEASRDRRRQRLQDLGRRNARLTRQLDDARARADHAEAILGDLRATGQRDEDGARWTDTAVRETGRELTDLESLAERERPALVLSAAAFEHEVAAEDEAASAAGPGPRIVSLSTATRGPLPADPYLYVHTSGRHGIGPAGAVTPGWRPVGRPADFAPLLWLLWGGPRRVPTVVDVVRTALGAAVNHLSGPSGRTEDQRVAETLGDRVGRIAETGQDLPARLPVGTWVWFTGPIGTGAAVVTPTGYRVHLTGGTGTTETAERDLRDALNRRPHTIVVSRVPVGVRPDRGRSVASSQGPDTSGGTARETSTQGTPRETGVRRGDGTRRESGTGRSISAEATTSRSAGRSEVETAARRATEIEHRAFDQARLDQVLRDRNLRPVEVPLDDNCFYHSLLAMAGPYLARHIPGLDIRTGGRAAVARLRNWLADRLQADLAVAAQGLPSRYGEFFHVGDDGGSIAGRQRALVDQIRRMDSWSNEAGDLVAHIAAHELGLPLTLVQDRYVTSLGPDGTARISFIRTPGHFRGAESTNPGAPRVPWETLRPEPPTSAENARRQLRVRTEALERQMYRAATDAETLLRRLPRDDGTARRAEVDAIADRFRQSRSPDARRHVPAHLSAQHRLDTMLREVRELERLNAEIRRRLGDPVPPAGVPFTAPRAGDGAHARTVVTDHLVNEVNARLRGFGRRWVGGAVDARELVHALLDLPHGGPTDVKGLATDLAHQIAFGEPPRARGGAMGLELETGFELGGLDPNDALNATLITTPAYSLVIDHAKARHGPNKGRTVPIIEIVLNPVNSLPGETGRLDRVQAFRTVTSVLDRLRTARRGETIADIFRDVPDARAHPYAERATLLRDFDRGRLYTQFTVGVPMSGIREFLRAVIQGHAYDGYWEALQNGESALAFGDAVAARYADIEDGTGPRGHLDRLAAQDPDLATVRNYATFLYTQVASQVGWIVRDNGLAKNYTLIASRVDLTDMRGSLPRPVRRFLEDNAAWIGRRFQDRYHTDNRSSIRRAGLSSSTDLLSLAWSYWDHARQANGPRHTVADYLNSGLIPTPPGGHPVSQWESLGIGTGLPKPDDNFGRRRSDPLAVLEVRFFGAQTHRDLAHVEEDYDRLERAARAVDRESGILQALKHGTGLEVRFAQHEHETWEPGQSSALQDFAAFVGVAAERRYAVGGRHVTVHISGGGNGGLLSNARTTGDDRAETVANALGDMIDDELHARGLPSYMVKYAVSSRGSRTSSNYPFKPAPGAPDEIQRRVRVWTDPGAERARDASAPATTSTTAAPLSAPWTNALTAEVNAALATMQRQEYVVLVNDQTVLSSYNALPPGLRIAPIPTLAQRIAEYLLTGRVTVVRGSGRVLPRPATGTGADPAPGDTTPAEPGPGGVREMNAEPPAGKGKRRERWQTVVREASGGRGTHHYQVSDAGLVRLPDGRELSPDGWARYGDDFLHLDAGVVLRGEDGRIEEVDGWESLRDLLDPDDLAPHTMWADETNVYLTSPDGGRTFGLPFAVFRSGSGTSLADDVYRMLSGTTTSPSPATGPAPAPSRDGTGGHDRAEESGSATPRRPDGSIPTYPVRTERWWPLRADDTGGNRSGEDAFVLTPNASGPPTMTRGARSGIRQPVRYDLVPGPQEWSFGLRFHLKPARGATQADLTRVTESVKAAAERYLNGPGRVLPGTDARMSVSVDFVADPGDAHAVIEVLPGTPGPGDRMDQVRWFAGAPLHAYAHEIAHFLGVRDTHGSPRALLRPAVPPGATRPGDLMGDARAEGDSYRLLDDHLAQIVEVAAPHLPPRPDLFRAGDRRPHTAEETGHDLPPEVDRALLVAEDQGTIVETEPGIVVYRAVETEPAEVFARGLRPNDPGNISALHNHVGTTGRTQFVSTTLDKNYHHKNRRYIYTVRSSESGIDVAKTLAAQGRAYLFSWEKEVAFTGTIPPEDIVEARDMRTGEVIPNPRYRGA